MSDLDLKIRLEIDKRLQMKWSIKHNRCGRRHRRARWILRDAWRCGGLPQPKGIRPRWHTYDRCAKKFGVTIWPAPTGKVSERDRFGKLPRHFVVNGVVFSPFR